jgi:hypothetical protein
MMVASAWGEGLSAENVLLPQGTALELMVLNEVSSRSGAVGQRFPLRLVKPVLVDGKPVLPIGSTAYGEVTASKRSGAGLKKGHLSVRLMHVELGSQRIELADEVTTSGKGGKSDDAVKILLAPMYAPFSSGNNAKLKAGDIIIGHVARDYRIILPAEPGGEPQLIPVERGAPL